MYQVSSKIKIFAFCSPPRHATHLCQLNNCQKRFSSIQNIWYFKFYGTDNSSRRYLPLRLDATRDYGIAARSFHLCQHSTIPHLHQNPSDSLDSFGDSFSSLYTPDSCGLATSLHSVPLSTVREVELAILQVVTTAGLLDDA